MMSTLPISTGIRQKVIFCFGFYSKRKTVGIFFIKKETLNLKRYGGVQTMGRTNRLAELN